MLWHFVGYAMVGYYHNVFGGVIFLEYSVVISASISIFLCLLCAMQIKLYFVLSLSLSGWSHLWFFNGFCLPNDQKGAINANCNRNQSFAPINPNILSRFLSACLPVCFSFSFFRLLMWFTICQSSHPTRKAFNSLSMDFKTHYDTLQRLGGDIDALGLSKDGLSSMRPCRCPALSLQTEVLQHSRECKVHNPVYAKLIKRKQKTKKQETERYNGKLSPKLAIQIQDKR